MAAPETVTLKDLNGKWVMNKNLSSATDPALALQGIGWITRKAIGIATVTQHLKQYVDEQGSTHIDFEQTATGGLKGTSEKRTLDYQWRAHTDYLFGDVKGRSRWTSLQNIGEGEGEANFGEDKEGDKAFLSEGWDEETKKEDVIESFVENEEKGWTAWQIWGFEVIDGERRHVRHVVVRKGKEAKKLKLVYDWLGKD